MKKFLSIVAILSLVFSPVTPAFAVEDGSPVRREVTANMPAVANSWYAFDGLGDWIVSVADEIGIEQVGGMSALTEVSGTGTFTFAGSSTVSGQVGETNAYLNAINVTNENSDKVYFGAEDAPTSVYFNSLNFGLNTTGKDHCTGVIFYGDASIGQGGESDGIATGTDGAGGIDFSGNAVINGNVGSSTAALYYIDLDVSGTKLTLKGNVYKSAGTTTAIISDAAGQTIEVGDGKNIEAYIFSYHADSTLTFLGSSIFTGEIGGEYDGSSPLAAVNLEGVAGTTVTINGDVYADDMNVGAGKLDLNGSFYGGETTLNFTGDGEVILANGEGIDHSVTTTAGNGTGTLSFEGDGEVTGSIGAEGAYLKAINVAQGYNYAVRLDDDVYVNQLNFGAMPEDWIERDGGDTTVFFEGDTTIGAGGITTGWNEYGVVEFYGDATINGDIGASEKALWQVWLDGADTKLTLNGNVYQNEVAGPDEWARTTIYFNNDDQTIEVADGKTIGADIAEYIYYIDSEEFSPDNSTLTFLGSATVTGDIGYDSWVSEEDGEGSIAPLDVVNFSGSDATTVTLSGDVYASEVNFTNDGFVTLTAGHDINADVKTSTHGTGTLTLEGDNVVNGDIGSGNALNVVNIGSGTVAVNGDLYANEVYVGAGTLEMDGDLMSSVGTVNFSGALDGTLELAGGHTIETDVSTATAGTGTLNFLGDGEVTGVIGADNALKAITLRGGAGTVVTLDRDVYAITMSVGAGTLNLNGSFYGDSPKTLKFTGDGEVVLADNESIEHNVTTETNGTGTLTFKGYGDVTGTVGIETPEEGDAVIKYLNAIKVNPNDSGDYVVKFFDDVYVNGVVFEEGKEIILGDDLTVNFTGDVYIGGDGIKTDRDGYGKVVFKQIATIDGSVGSALKHLSTLRVQDQAVFNAEVYTDYLKLKRDSEDASATFNGEAFIGEGGIATTDDGYGIVNFNSAATVDGDIGSGNYLNEVNIGSGTVTVNGDVYANDMNVGAGTLELNGSFYNPDDVPTTLNFTGDGEVILAGGEFVEGDLVGGTIEHNVETVTDGTGTLSFEGNGEVTGQIGAPDQSLGTINVAQGHYSDGEEDYGFSVDLGTDEDASVYVNNLNFGPESEENATDTEVTFHGDAYIGSGGITTEWPGYGIVSFDANAVVDGKVGTSTASCLWEINVANNGSSVDFNSAVYTSSLNFGEAGSSTEVTFNDNASIVFDQGSFDLEPEASTPVITTEDGYGIVNFNGNATVTGYFDDDPEVEDYLDAIGDSENALDEINIDGAAGTIVTVNGDLWSNDVNIGAGTLYMNGDLTSPSDNTVRFTGDGYLRVTAGHNINTNIVTDEDGTGTVTFGGGDNTVNGNIGSGEAALKAVNLTGDSDVMVTGDLYAYNVMLGTNVLTMGEGKDFTQKAGGTISLTLASGTADDNGHIYMDGGTATVEAGGNVSVTVPTGVSIANGTQFTVIDGGGDIALPTVTSNTRRYKFTPNVDTGDLVITASEGSYVAPAGATGNESSVANVLNGIPNPTGDMNTVLDQLGTLSDSEYEQALDTMHPDVSSGAADGSRSLTSQGFTTVSNRLGGARTGGSNSGISSGDRLDGVGVWMQALGSNIRQGERKGVEGYNGNLFGTTIGADKVIDKHFRAGFAGSYGWARVKSKTAGSPSDDINSFQGTIYGSFDSLDLNKARQGGKKSYEAVRSQVEKSWYVDGMFAFTQNNYDSRREIWVTPANKRVAKAEHYGQQYSTNFEAGYKFVFEKTKNLEVTPFVGLGYNYLYLNKYKENGASALNLSVDGQGFNQLEQSLGTKLAYPLVNKKMGTFIPSAKAAWLYDYISDTFETTASFAGGGASFNTQGAKPARNGMLFGAELAFLNKGNVTLTGNWDIELKDQYMSNTYYGTARYDF